MKKGDLVRYCGWSKNLELSPMALVVAVKFPESDFHKRIRVMWVGDIPIQARVISTKGSQISTWCAPKHFELVSEC